MVESSNGTRVPRPAPPGLGKRGWAGVAVALVLLAGAGGYAWLHFARQPAQAQAAPPPPPKVTVARPIVQKLVEWDDFTGRFEAIEHVDVRARVAGYLDSVHFTDGQIVEKGQLLFVIDPRPFQVVVDQSRAAVAAAEAALQLARNEVQRAESLRSSPAFQRSTFEDRQQSAAQAQAELNRAQAELAAAQLDLDFAQIRAPATGRLSDRRVDVGNLIGDSTLLTTIVSLDPIYLVFDMSEADFLAYQRAVLDGTLPSTRDDRTAVQGRLVDEPEFTRGGAMNFVDNVVDQGSGTVRGRAEFRNPNLLIAPGQFGEIRIPGSPSYDAILIPESAVVTDQSRKLVMVLGAGNKLEPRPIRLGPNELGLRVVRSGLKGDERIVINGLARARPGIEVTPEEGRIEPPSNFAEAG